MTFFERDDYLVYLRNLRELALITDTAVSAYCLMPNHVHLILVPHSRDSLITMVSELHQRYTRYINFKNNWRGHLWQGRFFSVALSPEHFEQCIRYVEMNPYRANMISASEKYEWSSDNIDFTSVRLCAEDFSTIREMTRTGRPRGNPSFLEKARQVAGFDLAPKRAGRKPGLELNP